MKDKYLYALVAFSATDIIGYHRFIKIKKTCANISDFLEYSIGDQMALIGVKTESAKKILLNMKSQADRILEQCEQKKISLIPHNNPLYPPLLKNIFDPPYLLYIQGQLNPHIPLIAVIGTRKSTPDAEKTNRWFCKSFVHYGIGIVNGLAQGHDAIAAQTALNNEGYAIGVLGTAIDTIYPKSSSSLFHRIKEKGALLSEYPPGMASTKWRFPRRNRIVSGLAQVLCVIQAPEKSGTMITVSMAAEQNKDVYVVPNNPMIVQNNGTNALIQKGAKIALNPDIIIQDILKSYPNLETVQFLAQKSPTLDSEENPEILSSEQNIMIKKLSLEEKQIWEHTQEHIHIDELVRILEINISSLNSILTMMEIKDIITQKPGQIYIRRT